MSNVKIDKEHLRELCESKLAEIAVAREESWVRLIERARRDSRLPFWKKLIGRLSGRQYIRIGPNSDDEHIRLKIIQSYMSTPSNYYWLEEDTIEELLKVSKSPQVKEVLVSIEDYAALVKTYR